MSGVLRAQANQINADFPRHLALLTIIRVVLNTAHRMAYPFLGVMARAIGVEVAVLSMAVSSRAFVGLLAPFISPLSDSYGRKTGLISGLALFILASLLLVFFPGVVTFWLCLLLGVLGKYLYDPSVMAYIGDRVAYSQRGKYISINETGWSLAFIVGMPLTAWGISRFGWVSPYIAFAILGVAGVIGIIFLLPSTPPHPEAPRFHLSNLLTTGKDIRLVAALSIGLWTTAGNEIVNMVFGVWLEDAFQVKLTALAAASAIIGLSELGGEGLVATFTDKLGKRKALMIGILSSILAAIALPLLATTQTGALAGLFFFYIAFEFVMVSHLPLMSEVLPSARATAMSMNILGFSIGRGVGAFLSQPVYQQFGFAAVTGISIAFNLIGLASLVIFSRIQRNGRLTAKVS